MSWEKETRNLMKTKKKILPKTKNEKCLTLITEFEEPDEERYVR